MEVQVEAHRQYPYAAPHYASIREHVADAHCGTATTIRAEGLDSSLHLDADANVPTSSFSVYRCSLTLKATLRNCARPLFRTTHLIPRECSPFFDLTVVDQQRRGYPTTHKGFGQLCTGTRKVDKVWPLSQPS